jgi:hypothetical protein
MPPQHLWCPLAQRKAHYNKPITDPKDCLANVETCDWMRVPQLYDIYDILCCLLTFWYLSNSFLHVPHWLNLITHVFLSPTTCKLVMSHNTQACCVMLVCMASFITVGYGHANHAF